jgi:GDP-4-dehydro-6-deoxy-D-mannose reductase
MKVLVTGASGFLGRHLIPLLVDRGHTVLATSRGQAPPAKVAYVAGDLADAAAAEGLVQRLAAFQPEVVVHLAGFASVGQSWTSPEDALLVNAVGTARLLRGLQPHPPKRVVVCGSSEVYAVGPPHQRLAETAPLGPTNPYGVSKLAQELLVRQWSARQGVEGIVFRMFNQTGPGQDDRFVVAKLVKSLVAMRSRGRSDRLAVGNLAAVRDFLDVRDGVRVLALAVEGRIPADVYNLCSGVGRSIRSVVVDLSALLALDPVLEVDPALYRQNEPRHIVGDPAKLNRWVTVTTISWLQTLQDMVARESPVLAARPHRWPSDERQRDGPFA